MSDAPPNAEDPVSDEAPPRPSRRPVWGGLAFLLLLMAVFLATQIFKGGGTEIVWMHDLDAALRQAKAENGKVYLVIHEPNCTVMTTMENSGIYRDRRNRKRLSRAVCCRLEMKPGTPLPRQIRFRDGLPRQFEQSPLTFALDAEGAVIDQQAGRLGPKHFRRLVDSVDPQDQPNDEDQ